MQAVVLLILNVNECSSVNVSIATKPLSSHFINDLQDPKIFKGWTWEPNWGLNTSGYFNLIYNNYIPGEVRREFHRSTNGLEIIPGSVISFKKKHFIQDQINARFCYAG